MRCFLELTNQLDVPGFELPVRMVTLIDRYCLDRHGLGQLLGILLLVNPQTCLWVGTGLFPGKVYSR